MVRHTVQYVLLIYRTRVFQIEIDISHGLECTVVNIHGDDFAKCQAPLKSGWLFRAVSRRFVLANKHILRNEPNLALPGRASWHVSCSVSTNVSIWEGGHAQEINEDDSGRRGGGEFAASSGGAGSGAERGRG